MHIRLFLSYCALGNWIGKCILHSEYWFSICKHGTLLVDYPRETGCLDCLILWYDPTGPFFYALNTFSSKAELDCLLTRKMQGASLR